jgi:hypothetical protein
MDAPQDGTQGPDPGREDGLPKGDCRQLRRWLIVLGVHFMLLGGMSLSLTCCAGGIVLWFWDVKWFVPSPDEMAAHGLLFLGWAVTPVVSGALLLRGADRLAKRPGGESATFLVAVVAAAFVGLAWVAVTAALVFRESLR